VAGQSGNDLQVDFSGNLRQTVGISVKEDGCQSIPSQDVANSALRYP
jgi:hypothetical protein